MFNIINSILTNTAPKKNETSKGEPENHPFFSIKTLIGAMNISVRKTITPTKGPSASGVKNDMSILIKNATSTIMRKK